MAEVAATTVSGPSSHRPASAGTVPVLAWLFPRWQEPTALAGDDSGERVIGRDPSCAIELSGNDVSRRHAALRRDEAGATLIADLGSRNGVRVNGRLVGSAPLAPGDVVRLGGWVAVVTTNAGALGEIAPGVWGGGALAAALAPLQRAATSDLPIVLEGETGTGKEMAARRPPPLERPDRSVRRGELRRASRGAGRGRAVRLPAGRVHRRRPREPRILPERGGRDAAARRGLGSAAAAAGEAAARARAARGAAAGRVAAGADRRAGGRRRAALADGVGARRALPRRSARAPRWPDGAPAAAARASRRRRAAVRAAARRRSVTGARPPSTARSPNGCACTTGRSTCASWCCS